MRNNFTFRSRTETYFTHLSAQPLMILILFFKFLLIVEIFTIFVRAFVIAQTLCFFDSTKSNQRTKSRSSFVVCVCARIFLYRDVFSWRHLDSPKFRPPKFRIVKLTKWKIAVNWLIDFFNKKHENVNNFAKN